MRIPLKSLGSNIYLPAGAAARPTLRPPASASPVTSGALAHPQQPLRRDTTASRSVGAFAWGIIRHPAGGP